MIDLVIFVVCMGVVLFDNIWRCVLFFRIGSTSVFGCSMAVVLVVVSIEIDVVAVEIDVPEDGEIVVDVETVVFEGIGIVVVVGVEIVEDS